MMSVILQFCNFLKGPWLYFQIMALRRFVKKFWKKESILVQHPTHAISAEDLVAEEPFEFTDTQKDNLRSSWKIIYSEIGQVLSFVNGKEDGMKLALKLFEDYPQSQQFFLDFKGTPIEDLKKDPKLNYAMQQHAIRVTRIVEKVIGRLDHLEMVLSKES